VRGGELVGISGLAQLDYFFKFFLAQIEEAALKFRIEHSGLPFFVNSVSG
jgi:hypothetical protein